MLYTNTCQVTGLDTQLLWPTEPCCVKYRHDIRVLYVSYIPHSKVHNKHGTVSIRVKATLLALLGQQMLQPALLCVCRSTVCLADTYCVTVVAQ